MTHFLAVYTGSEAAMARSGWTDLDDATRAARSAEALAAWRAWAERHADVIVDGGAPLGRTKRVDPSGVSDVANALTGYVVVRAASHAEAAALFVNHPHFTIFPGDAVEIMPCLPMPGA